MSMKPDDLIKSGGARPLHLNVRITGEDAKVFAEFVRRTPGMSDSQRVRDAVRLALYAIMTGEPIVKKLGVFRA